MTLADELLELAIREDIGDGDHSSLCCIPNEAQGAARLLIKEAGVLAGVSVAVKVFHRYDSDLEIEVFLSDGDEVKYGDIGLIVKGKKQSILSAERVVLNLMQRMSGIATNTARIMKLVEGTDVKVLDTRKTTPGLRWYEKEAVKIGGGTNHRFGLYDMIMLKDNHIDYAGGIENAISKAKAYLKEKGKSLPIEVETRNIDEVNQVLTHGPVDRIMLDNFTPDQIREALKVIDGQCQTEASGGINESTVRSYAETGVDYLSMGALTHSVKSLDISLKAIEL
ncbi:MAG: carboxylating nicotinate-nucleotide diphosphorylase [Flavobacteriales bacterium]